MGKSTNKLEQKSAKKPDQKSTMTRKYIAYGSNLNLPQMDKRCPTATQVGTAVIEDYQLLFRGSKSGNYATIEPKVGANVPVLIWEVGFADELALDRYEGYPSFYGKKSLTVNVNGQEMDAMVYTMPTSHKLGLPSQQYVNVIAEGYQTAGFDLGILADAIQVTQEKMKKEVVNQFQFKEEIWEEYNDFLDQEDEPNQSSFFEMG